MTTLKRANALPDIPAVNETIAGYEAVGWVAILGPKALPNAVVTRWNQEINGVLQLPEVKECLAGDSMEAIGGSPEHLRDMLKQEVAKWRNAVRVAGVKAEK